MTLRLQQQRRMGDLQPGDRQ